MEQHMKKEWPEKCDCGCGRPPVIEFDNHFFHEWSCTGGYRLERLRVEERPPAPVTFIGT